jgi:hypothetical protein
MEPLLSEILDFFGPSKWMVGQFRLVAKKRIFVDLEMGGLGVPHPDETIKDFIRIYYRKLTRKADCNHWLFFPLYLQDF